MAAQLLLLGREGNESACYHNPVLLESADN